MDDQPRQYQPGDVVNGYMMSSNGQWLPVGQPPHQLGEPASYGYSPQHMVHVHGDPASHSALAPVTSLVTGLMALAFCWIPLIGVIAWLLAPIALIFGVIGTQRGKSEHKIMSAIGLVCGGIALIVCVLWVVTLALA